MLFFQIIFITGHSKALPTTTLQSFSIRHKSTLTLQQSSSVVIPNQKIYKPQEESPDRTITIDGEAPDVTSLKTARKIPKVATKPYSADPHLNSHFPKLDVARFRGDNSPLEAFSYSRKVKSKKISKHMQLLTPEGMSDQSDEKVIVRDKE